MSWDERPPTKWTAYIRIKRWNFHVYFSTCTELEDPACVCAGDPIIDRGFSCVSSGSNLSVIIVTIWLSKKLMIGIGGGIGCRSRCRVFVKYHLAWDIVVTTLGDMQLVFYTIKHHSSFNEAIVTIAFPVCVVIISCSGPGWIVSTDVSRRNCLCVEMSLLLK